MPIFNQKYLLTLLLILVFFQLGNAQHVSAPAPLSLLGQAAFTQLLKDTNVFAVGATGFAGTKSRGELALRELLKESDRINTLIFLAQNAKPEGAMYALLGLKYTDHGIYKRELEQLKRAPLSQELTFMVGCSIEKITTAQLISLIDSDHYDKEFVP